MRRRSAHSELVSVARLFRMSCFPHQFSGFYSLFSITEEPFVTSGGQWMGFYWKDKKDQLFARRGTLPPTTTPSDGSASEGKAWTSFEMPLREPAPIPFAFDLTRFLCSSITFMANLRDVQLFFDGARLARLTKDSGSPARLPIPLGLKTTSPTGMMTVKAIMSTRECDVLSISDRD